MRKVNCKAYGTKAQGLLNENQKSDLLIPTSEEARQYFEAHLRVNKIQCPEGVARETSGERPFYFAGGDCRKCDLKWEKDNIIQAWTHVIHEEKSNKGKALLQVAHYRMVEIERSEIEDLVNVIKNSGADTCESSIINTFFRLTKKRLGEGMGRCLDDREVMDLWKQFKETLSCLSRKGDM